MFSLWIRLHDIMGNPVYEVFCLLLFFDLIKIKGTFREHFMDSSRANCKLFGLPLAKLILQCNVV